MLRGEKKIVLLKIEDPDRLPRAIQRAASPGIVGSAVLTIGYLHYTAMRVRAKLTCVAIPYTLGLRDDPKVYHVSMPIQTRHGGTPLLNMKR